MTPDDRPRRPLDDDPNFQASLSDLDRDLGQPRRVAIPAGPAASVPNPVARAAPIDAPPLSDLALKSLLPISPSVRPVSGGGRRRLIDLFPPTDLMPAAPASPVLAPPEARQATAPSAASESARTQATYETFYGLHEAPFSLSTDPRFFYHSIAHDQAAQALLGAIGRRERVVVMTGDNGLGKTTLCRTVVDQLDRRTLTSLVAEPFVSTEALLKTVLADFGVISRDDIAGKLASASRADLITALHDFLISLAALQAFAVVILDEAHALPNELLEQIRSLAEDLGDEPLLQIVLVGLPSLEKRLDRAALRPLRQLIATRCRLKPIAADEVSGYIAHRVAVAGTAARVEFDETAAARIYALTRGVPRDINLLCDATLEAGFMVSASLLDDQLVDEAALELNLTPPASRREKLAFAMMMLLLVALGAAAAAFVFRADLSSVVGEWQERPAPRTLPQPGSGAPSRGAPPR